MTWSEKVREKRTRWDERSRLYLIVAGLLFYLGSVWVAHDIGRQTEARMVQKDAEQRAYEASLEVKR